MINNPTTLIGTTSQVLVNGTAGTLLAGPLTLTLPQSIATSSTPTFASLTLSGLTANSFLYSNGAKSLTSAAAATNGQLLIGSTGLAPSLGSITGGTGLGITLGAGTIALSNTGVTSIAGTSNQITASTSTGAVTLSLPSSVTITTGLTVSGLTANSFLYSGTAGLLSVTTAPTNGQLLIGSTGAAPVKAGLTAGTGISVTNGAGSISIANTGVTSVSGTGTVSGLTLSGTVTTTGNLTLGGTLAVTPSNFASQTANTVLAAPSGSAGVPTFRALAYTDLPLALYVENPSTPITPTATGANAIATGSGSSASIFGTSAFANGTFATSGDAQEVHSVLRNITTTNSITELFLNGVTGTQRLILPNNSAWTFIVKIAARRTDAVGTLGSWIFQGFIYKDTTAASTVLTGLSKTTLARIGSISVQNDPSIVADTTNGSIKINCTGVTAQTIRWVATIQMSQVTN